MPYSQASSPPLAPAQIHDAHWHKVVVGGLGELFEAFCSCGYRGALVNAESAAQAAANAHAASARQEQKRLDQAGQQPVAAHIVNTSGSGAMGWKAVCSCGWKAEGLLTQRGALKAGESHIAMEGNSAQGGDRKHHSFELEVGQQSAQHYFHAVCVCGWESERFPHNQPGAEAAIARGNDHLEYRGSPPMPTEERKSGDSVWERHKVGDCADPCVYCMDERAERRTRPAAQIMAELEAMQARVVSLESDDAELPRVEGVRDALAWVLRVHGYTEPS